MRIFKNAWFARYARKERLGDRALCEAIRRAERGLIDADLGGEVIKQRVARPGEGKSSGYRIIILFRAGQQAFLVFGFAKSHLDNIGGRELKDFRRLAKALIGLSDGAIAALIEDGQLFEVKCDGEEIS